MADFIPITRRQLIKILKQDDKFITFFQTAKERNDIVKQIKATSPNVLESRKVFDLNISNCVKLIIGSSVLMAPFTHVVIAYINGMYDKYCVKKVEAAKPRQVVKECRYNEKPFGKTKTTQFRSQRVKRNKLSAKEAISSPKLFGAETRLSLKRHQS